MKKSKNEIDEANSEPNPILAAELDSKLAERVATLKGITLNSPSRSPLRVSSRSPARIKERNSPRLQSPQLIKYENQADRSEIQVNVKNEINVKSEPHIFTGAPINDVIGSASPLLPHKLKTITYNRPTCRKSSD